jgi:SMI1/KNR4 family protein SUKH-1
LINDLTAALADIEARLEQLGRQILLAALKPGLDAEHVRSLLGRVGLPRSAQVESLYSWKDGTETAGIKALGDISFFPGYYLLSLEDAVSNYRAFVPDRRWMPGWLPIFANGGGDFYFIDVSGEMTEVVRHFRIEEAEHPIEFLTVGDMLVTIAAGYDRGVFFVNGNGFLDMDYVAFGTLAAEMNPRVPWWID